jgi:hypothetical protein
MEIVFGIVIFGVVVYLCYLWAGDSTDTRNDTVTATDPRYGLYGNTENTYQFGDTIQSTDDSGVSVDAAEPSQSDDTGQQNCANDSSSSAVDFPCPTDATSYDSAGCAVDSGSSDIGNSN